jgi:hypothetical protein
MPAPFAHFHSFTSCQNQTNLPFNEKLLDFRLPNKENEDNEALQAVEKVADVEE